MVDNQRNNIGGAIFMETREIAQKIIGEIGEDRLKKYWFGVAE